MLRSVGISCNFTLKYMPVGITKTKDKEANIGYPILSQQAVVQSISKNTIPYASSVHMKNSINIAIKGI